MSDHPNHPPMKSKKWFNLSLRVKMLVIFTLLFAAMFAGAFYWFYTFATDQALGRIEEDLLNTLNGAIEGVNGNEFEVLARQGEAGEDGVPEGNPIYNQHQEWIEEIVRVEPRAIPYTFVPTETDLEVAWVGDAFRVIPERQPDQTSFLDTYDASNTFLYDGLTEVTVDIVGYEDNWGTWVSAYGPIRNNDGDVVGGFGIDFNRDYVDQVQQDIQDTIAVAFISTYLVFFLLVYLFSTYLTRPIVALTDVANEIGEGKYDQDLTKMSNVRLTDEISSLAGVFDIMVDKVAEREQTLKKKVASLEIMIDESKRDQEVEELTDNEFFQDIAAKARDLRKAKADANAEFKKKKDKK